MISRLDIKWGLAYRASPKTEREIYVCRIRNLRKEI